jgi:hypothetical protein
MVELRTYSRSENAITGYVSHPTHANLAGQIAAGLAESLFGELPDAVVDIISKHDVGWAEVDLIALEHAAGKRPDSFLRITPSCAIAAWHRSIAAAEKVSPLAAHLTRKHFYLLAPRDHDRAHQDFIEEQGNCLAAGDGSTYPVADLERFVAALGFCDLLSLHLCSGSGRSVRIPLAHPADPTAHFVRSITISTIDDRVFADVEPAWKPTVMSIGGWGPEGQTFGNNLSMEAHAPAVAHDRKTDISLGGLMSGCFLILGGLFRLGVQGSAFLLENAAPNLQIVAKAVPDEVGGICVARFEID